MGFNKSFPSLYFQPTMVLLSERLGYSNLHGYQFGGWGSAEQNSWWNVFVIWKPYYHWRLWNFRPQLESCDRGFRPWYEWRSVSSTNLMQSRLAPAWWAACWKSKFWKFWRSWGWRHMMMKPQTGNNRVRKLLGDLEMAFDITYLSNNYNNTQQHNYLSALSSQFHS